MLRAAIVIIPLPTSKKKINLITALISVTVFWQPNSSYYLEQRSVDICCPARLRSDAASISDQCRVTSQKSEYLYTAAEARNHAQCCGVLCSFYGPHPLFLTTSLQLIECHDRRQTEAIVWAQSACERQHQHVSAVMCPFGYSWCPNSRLACLVQKCTSDGIRYCTAGNESGVNWRVGEGVIALFSRRLQFSQCCILSACIIAFFFFNHVFCPPCLDNRHVNQPALEC